jgi:CspA family cold shock protein
MASGKVKWWNNKSGFGFISQESGQDVFVHHTSVIGQGFKVLNPGDEVTFEIVATEKGPKAEKVQLARFN